LEGKGTYALAEP